MALKHWWTGRNEAEKIAWVRLHCYGGAATDMPKFMASATDDVRAHDGDFLLAERDGKLVGTATSLHLHTHIHGAAMGVHGVAYVGAVRTERRRASIPGEAGVATVVMQESVRMGRERGDMVSALMPFRASYYEHFGYGLMEHMAAWTIPAGVLPSGDAGNFVAFEDRHLAGLVSLRQKISAGGHCDIERPEGEWRRVLKRAEGGFLFVDEGKGWLWLNTESEGGVMVGKVMDWGAPDAAAFLRLLRMLGSLKDQYSKFYLTTPTDWPVNMLLRESQVPHRPAAHATASLTQCTRMQMRVLDHKRFLEAIHWPGGAKGEMVLAVKECEGHESRLAVRVEGGRAEVRASTATPTYVISDRTYAGVVTGDITASTAVRFGLAEGNGALLDTLAMGRKPFSFDGF